MQELENADNWDFENAERHSGGKASRVVVSVAFHREDFSRVAERAERTGMKTSEYIREAALEKATHEEEMARVSSFSGSLGSSVFTPYPLSVTRVSTPREPDLTEDSQLASLTA